MMSIWPELPTPLIIAHRGASAYAPENTLAAFQLAGQQGAQAVELDAKLSADGHVVAIHDRTVDRTTDGQGRVADLPLAALRELDAGAFFSARFQGERIPTLEEVFEAVGEQVYINVELTNYATPGDDLVEKAARLVERHGLGQRVLFSSFLPLNLGRARRLLPEVPCGLLTLPGLPGWLGRRFGYLNRAYAALHPNLADTDEGLVRDVHRRGRRVYVWTVNDPQEMLRLQALGVDGIITDDPPLACQTLGRPS
jgi:glycerophosphoryl diester phosphodiesterase